MTPLISSLDGGALCYSFDGLIVDTKRKILTYTNPDFVPIAGHVIPNIPVEDIIAVDSAKLGGSWILTYLNVTNITTLGNNQYLLSGWDAAYTKGLLIELSNQNNGTLLKVISARYKQGQNQDFTFGYNTAYIANTHSSGGYGLAEFTISYYGD